MIIDDYYMRTYKQYFKPAFHYVHQTVIRKMENYMI